MKKITLLFIFLISTSSFAQISIGAGDDGDGLNSPPITPYYGYSYSQSIYLANEINASGDITSLKYALNPGSNFSSADESVDVWIGHTTKTSFDSTSDWIDVSTLTQVLTSGLVTVENDVLTITFSSAFSYNGTDNLVVAVDANEAGYGSSSSYVLSTDASTSNMTLDQRSDSVNADPNSPPTGTQKQNRGNITFIGISQACPEVSNLIVSNITTSSADVSWTAGDSETLWNIEVVDVTAGETADGSVDYTSSANSYSLTSLSANNEYEVYVQADCGAGETSSWAGPVSFTTSILTSTVGSACVDFENGSLGVNVGLTENTNSSASISDTAANASNYGVLLTGGSSGLGWTGGSSSTTETNAWVDNVEYQSSVNFEVDATSESSVALSFDLKQTHTYGPTYSNFRVTVNGTQIGNTLNPSSESSDDFVNQIYNLSAYAGTIFNLKLEFSGKYNPDYTMSYPSGDSAYIDNICLTAPQCLTPGNIAALNITASSADISWDAGGSETLWNMEVVDVTAGETADGSVDYTSSINSYSLTSLSANNEYEVYVQSDCGADGTSSWAGPVSFTTAVSCGYIIYDSGGATGDYANNELLIVTAFPDTAGELVTFTFDSFATESGYDKIWVYDGPDTSSSVLIDGVSGSTIPNPVTSSHSTGALTFKFDSDGSSVDAGFQVTVSCAPPPSCTTPTALAMDNITDSSADVSWIAGDSETLWNIEVVDVTAGETADGSVDYTSSANSYSLTSLSANNEYEVYVQADCGVDGTSEWSVAASFTTDCAVFSQSYNHGFDADNNGIVADASCWAVINQGSTNGWVLTQDSTTGNVYWNLTYSMDQHSDWLISPKFTVTDNLTDAFAFDGWNGNPSWGNEVIDVLVYDTNLTLLGTLATDLSLPAESEDTNFVYDLSSYENQDIRIAFYSSTEFLSYSRIDNFQVDSYTSLGIQDNSISLFNYFPNPVNDVLTIKAQKDVDNITVYNMLGQVVIRQTPNTRDCTVNLSTMQTGAYFVQVSIDNSVETVRILKN